MFIIYGVRSYGAVDCEDGSQHATRFVHVYYLPLVPMGGVRISPEGDEQAASIDLKSLLLAYARVWGFALAVGLSFNAYFELEKSLVSGLVWTAITMGVLAATLVTWFKVGVRRASSPLSLGLGIGIPFLALAIVAGAGVKENLHRKISRYSFDSNGAPSAELMALAKAETEREQQAAFEKKQARCDAGEAAVCNDVGYALAKTDRAASIAAYQKGCDLDYAMSCFNLALNVGKTEPAKSPPLYERACELGYGDGCNNLATGFEKSDRKRAVELFGKACKLESELGCKNLARLQKPAKKKRG